MGIQVEIVGNRGNSHYLGGGGGALARMFGSGRFEKMACILYFLRYFLIRAPPSYQGSPGGRWRAKDERGFIRRTAIPPSMGGFFFLLATKGFASSHTEWPTVLLFFFIYK